MKTFRVFNDQDDIDYLSIRKNVVENLVKDPVNLINNLWYNFLERDIYCVNDLDVSINRDEYLCFGCNNIERLAYKYDIKESDINIFSYIRQSYNKGRKTEFRTEGVIFVDEFTGSILIDWLCEYFLDLDPHILFAYICRNRGFKILNALQPNGLNVEDVINDARNLTNLFSKLKLSILGSDVYISEGKLVVDNFVNCSIDVPNTNIRLASQTINMKMLPYKIVSIKWKDNYFMISSKDDLQSIISQAIWIHSSLNFYYIIKSLIDLYPEITSQISDLVNKMWKDSSIKLHSVWIDKAF